MRAFIVWERPVYPDQEKEPAGIWMIANKKATGAEEKDIDIPAVFTKRSLAHLHADLCRREHKAWYHGEPDRLPVEALVTEVQLP